jgi:predicted component of type VI protein secretion system
MASVNHGQFSFDGRTFNVTSSDGHIHRRASHADLRALFDTSMPDRSNRPDYTTHWYEAQLLHYGLPSSRKRTTAKMRLQDALQDEALKVPKETLKIEADLRKHWEKQEFEARLRASGVQGSVDTRSTNTTIEAESATIRTITADDAPRRKLGTPFCPETVVRAGISSNNGSQNKRSPVSFDQPRSKKSKIEQPAIQHLQPVRFYHGNTGTNENSHFRAHINSNDPQESMAFSPAQRPKNIECGFPKSEKLFPQAEHGTTPSSHESATKR